MSYCFPDRFEAKINRMGPIAPALGTRCWVWDACKTKNGYGRLTYRYKNWLAHVFAYVLTKGSVPGELELDHLCRVRACVNPDHLEPVTRAENIRRGEGNPHRRKTHCPQGHAYDEENTLRYRGRRYCKACRRSRRR